MSTEFDAASAASALLSLSGDASKQIVRLGNRLLELDWNTMSFKVLDELDVQNNTFTRHLHASAQQNNVLVNENPKKRLATSNGMVCQGTLPPFKRFKKMLKPMKTLRDPIGRSNGIRPDIISDEELAKMSHFTWFSCQCQIEENQNCGNLRTLLCHLCPMTTLCGIGKKPSGGFEDLVRGVGYGRNPIKCRTPVDVSRNYKAHVKARERNWHEVWNALHKLHQLLEAKTKVGRSHELVEELLQKQKLYLKMKEAFQAAGLVDTDKAKECGNFVKFQMADKVFEEIMKLESQDEEK